MSQAINEALLSDLISEIDRLPGAFPGGYMKRNVDWTGCYEEGGMTFVTSDALVGLHYAGLAVLARDMHQYLARHPRSDVTTFEQVVSLVHDEESALHGAGAFPDYAGLPADSLPGGLSAAADNGHFVLSPLADRSLVHEWTFKPGKRLFVRFCDNFKQTICGKDGPYEQFTEGLVGQASLPTSIASAILMAGFSAATFWYPLAAYLSILLVKTGLKTYCEG